VLRRSLRGKAAPSQSNSGPRPDRRDQSRVRQGERAQPLTSAGRHSRRAGAWGPAHTEADPAVRAYSSRLSKERWS